MQKYVYLSASDSVFFFNFKFFANETSHLSLLPVFRAAITFLFFSVSHHLIAQDQGIAGLPVFKAQALSAKEMLLGNFDGENEKFYLPLDEMLQYFHDANAKGLDSAQCVLETNHFKATIIFGIGTNSAHSRVIESRAKSVHLEGRSLNSPSRRAFATISPGFFFGVFCDSQKMFVISNAIANGKSVPGGFVN